MRGTVALFALLAAAAGSGAETIGPDGRMMGWEPPPSPPHARHAEAAISEAVAAARDAGRPALVIFVRGAEMDLRVARIERDPRVRSVARERLGGAAVRVDVARRPDLADRFGIWGTPTFVLLDADGGEIRRHEGEATVAEIEAFLQGTPAGVKRDEPAPPAAAASAAPAPAPALLDPLIEGVRRRDAPRVCRSAPPCAPSARRRASAPGAARRPADR